MQHDALVPILSILTVLYIISIIVAIGMYKDGMSWWKACLASIVLFLGLFGIMAGIGGVLTAIILFWRWVL